MRDGPRNAIKGPILTVSRLSSDALLELGMLGRRPSMHFLAAFYGPHRALAKLHQAPELSQTRPLLTCEANIRVILEQSNPKWAPA